MLEGIVVVAAEPAPASKRATPRIDPALRRARTCYDHIASELGVAITDALVARRAVELSDEGATVTAAGRALFSAAAFPLNSGAGNRRLYCRPCLDWSERRPHLAGVLGKALLERALETNLVRQREGSRALGPRQRMGPWVNGQRQRFTKRKFSCFAARSCLKVRNRHADTGRGIGLWFRCRFRASKRCELAEVDPAESSGSNVT